MILLLIVISQAKMWISWWNLLWTLFEKINNVLPLWHHFQYGFDTSEFTYNPAEPNRLAPNAAPPTEDRSRCSILWNLVVEFCVYLWTIDVCNWFHLLLGESCTRLFPCLWSYVAVCWKVLVVLFSYRVMLINWLQSGEGSCNLWAQWLPLMPSSASRWWIHVAKFYECKMLRMIYCKWNIRV